ncbi:MAG TPA: ribonuclease III [Polyangiaceae bacterium]|nr:ribonuclease III [Polyangiaceae bacterium]
MRNDFVEQRDRVAALVGLPSDAPRLDEALTHPSYSNERRDLPDNQRLEFLGDAVLGFCVGELLFVREPNANEGMLTRMRAQLVSAEALSLWAREHELSKALRLGRGAEAAGLSDATNVLADAVEALVAAVFLERGLDAARALCASIAEPALRAVGPELDPKSELQERLQAQSGVAPSYELVETTGPAHDRWFRVEVRHQGMLLGEGRGKSKRGAERAAAAQALAQASSMKDDQAAPSAEETEASP